MKTYKYNYVNVGNHIIKNGVTVQIRNCNGSFAYTDAELEAMGVVITETPDATADEIKLARSVFSKLEIRSGFIALGIESSLDILLSNNSEFNKYWLEADSIDLNHAVTVQALANFTTDEINNIKLAI